MRALSVHRLIALGAVALGVPAVSRAQDSTRTPDYARTEQFFTWNLKRHVFGDTVEVHWIRDTDRFWYRVRTRRGHEFKIVDAARNSSALLFDNAKLASALSIAIDSTYEPTKLPFTTFDLDSSERQITFNAGKRRLRCDIGAYRCVTIDTLTDRLRSAIRSPDGKWWAFVASHNLYIRSANCPGSAAPSMCGDSIQLTMDGDTLRPYGRDAVFRGVLAARFFTMPYLAWSPDSRKIAINRPDDRGILKMPLYSSTTTRPTYFLYPYALPGDTAAPKYDIHIVDIAARSNVRVAVDPISPGNDTGFMQDTAWLSAKWSRGSDRLFFIHSTRGAKKLALMVADAATGAARPLAVDSATTPSGTVDVGNLLGVIEYWSPPWRVTPDENNAFWYSGRDGWGHIYRFDRNGKIRNQVTSGAWGFHSLIRYDSTDDVLYFTARGRESDRFYYYTHFYKVRADGTGTTLLTPEPANHQVFLSPSGRYFVDSYSTLWKPPVIVLRSTRDAKVIRELERADVSDLLAIGWAPPDTFSAVAADGSTQIYGYYWKPSNFDSTKRYPVVDYIYPVPNANIRQWGWTISNDLEARAVAELGFIVTQVMPRGTSSRSKAFWDTWQGRMGQNTLPDRVTAIKQLGARHRFIDLDRVGIYGLSGGGFASTAGILRFPDFYKAAVSMNGNHDNRSYGTFWGEKYQGLYTKDPKTGKDNYEDEANYTLAANLEGKLLLMVGDMDDNVHPVNTYRVVHALIAANKKFDLMVFPDEGHGLRGVWPYALRAMFDHFTRYLIGVEPPDYTFANPVY